MNRFDIYLVCLEGTIGHEIRKTRPCLIISPNEMNQHISTVLIAPMTTQGQDYPTRISCTFQSKKGQIVLDQLRTVDKERLIKKLGKIDSKTQSKVLTILGEIFAP